MIPGFENFNARIRENIFYLPNAPRDHRKFNNGIGKAKFITSPLPDHKLEKGQYVMMSIRSHDQFNTHIYGLDDRYRGIYNGRRVIFMHKDDVREAGLQQGQLVDLTSHSPRTRRATAKALHGHALRYPARLYGDVLPGDERVGFHQQHR